MTWLMLLKSRSWAENFIFGVSNRSVCSFTFINGLSHHGIEKISYDITKMAFLVKIHNMYNAIAQKTGFQRDVMVFL